MTIQVALLEILLAVISATLPVVTVYVIKFLNSKMGEAKKQAATDEEERILESIRVTVTDAVNYVNQTFVDSLKNKGEFTKDNQKIAFKLALDNIQSNLTDKAKEFITTNYGDIQTWLSTKIEVSVKEQKSE